MQEKYHRYRHAKLVNFSGLSFSMFTPRHILLVLKVWLGFPIKCFRVLCIVGGVFGATVGIMALKHASSSALPTVKRRDSVLLWPCPSAMFIKASSATCLDGQKYPKFNGNGVMQLPRRVRAAYVLPKVLEGIFQSTTSYVFTTIDFKHPSNKPIACEVASGISTNQLQARGSKYLFPRRTRRWQPQDQIIKARVRPGRTP